MCDGVVIDAHVIKRLTPELVEEDGPTYRLVRWITGSCGIAISEPIKVHWEQHCGSRERNVRFWEWYFDELHNKRAIHPIPVKRWSGEAWRALSARHKIPKDPFVRAVIECADATSEPRYILADDMLFHEPAAKAASTANQQEIRGKRIGSLCQHLEHELSIVVGTPDHCSDYFEVNQGGCPTMTNGHSTACPRCIGK